MTKSPRAYRSPKCYYRCKLCGTIAWSRLNTPGWECDSCIDGRMHQIHLDSDSVERCGKPIKHYRTRKCYYKCETCGEIAWDRGHWKGRPCGFCDDGTMNQVTGDELRELQERYGV